MRLPRPGLPACALEARPDDMPTDERIPARPGAHCVQRATMNRAVGTGARIGFALAILALLVGGWLTYDNLRRIRRNDGLVVHSHAVLDEIRDTLNTLAAAESSQRSYLINEDASYLRPYQANSDLGQGHVDRMRALTVDNSMQQTRLATLGPIVS